MNLKNNYILFIYSILYLSLLFGFYFNEDFTLGYKTDHFIHLEIISLFENNFLATLLNFNNNTIFRSDDLDFTTAHSPFFYIIYLSLKKILFGNDFLLRLINLHISLLIPFIFYLLLKNKFHFKKNDIRILIPGIFFLSPYFRSGAIWIGSENISLIFLFASFYFYLLFSINKNKKFHLIILNIIFLSLACYFRPIFSIFSIYFFFALYKDLINIKKIFQYILINIILAFPAFYYVFILGVNFFAMHIDHPITISRFVNQFAIASSILFYYSIPFVVFNFNELKKTFYELKNYFIILIYLIILFIFFHYAFSHGGGIFYKFSNILFSNNYIFYFISCISLIYFKNVFIDKIKIEKSFNDLILFFTLIFLEIDTVIYHETYDLIFYVIFFTLAKNIYFLNFLKKPNKIKITFLYCFSSFFLIITILKNYI